MVPTAYESPLTIRRPHGSYRFDVFSMKAGRRMTLFGKAALSQFIELEADHEVAALCERPLKIPDSKPTRVIDFWALRGGRSHFYLLLSASGARDMSKPKLATEDFRKWVEGERAFLHEVVTDVFNERRLLHDNWAAILQHLVAHRGLVGPTLLERCAIEMRPAFSLEQIESQMTDLDTMLVRAAVYSLLAGGKLICPSIAQARLTPATQFVRP